MSGIDQILNDNANSRTLAPQAVLSQVLLMIVVSAATVLAFNVLRPNNKVIYEPKIKYHDGKKTPPRISDSPLGWISPLLHVKEPELVDKLGLDAATFLRFLRMMRWLFTIIAALSAAMLIPPDIIYNARHVPGKDRDILSIMTLRDVEGDTLLFHIAAMYIITGVVFFFCYMHTQAMVGLRRAWHRSPEYRENFYARTLLIQHVPKKFQSDDGIRNIFESVQVPYPTTAVHIGRRVGRLPDLIEEHNNNVRELERHLVRYLKRGRLAKNRPKVRVGGFMGFGGNKVDAIDLYTEKLKQTEARVEAYRAQIDRNKAENYGFASMAAVPYAHIVARMLRGKHPKGTTIALAPNPKDIIWENLTLSSGDVARKKTMGFLILALVCFLNTLPLFVISILANLSSIAAYVTFLQTWQAANQMSFTIVSGILPPAVSALFGYLLPRIIRALSRYQGALTQSRLDRAIVARYFAFLVISQLIIFTLIGVGFNAAKEIVAEVGKKSFQDIINNLHTLPDTINRTYVEQSSYWLTFFPLRGFLVFFDWAQIVNLIWITIKKRLFGRTPREVRDWCKPPDFEYAIYYSNMLFMGAVALVFAPLAPLVAVSAAVVFWISSWVYKYQLMFVFTTKVETGGRLWNPIINRLLWSLILMQLLMVLTMILQFGWNDSKWTATIPPLLFVGIFKAYLDRQFSHRFKYYVPSEQELREARVHSERADNRGNRLANRFGHPAFHSELFTPMVHANMVPLLAQVFDGTKIGNEKRKMNEMGGQRLQAAVIDGVRIAGIDEAHLEYDPTLYRRDRGELDWDARSVATTAMFGGSDAGSLAPSKSVFYANGRSGSPAPSLPGGPGRFDAYLEQGPGKNEYEMSQLDLHAPGLDDQAPLLAYGQPPPGLGMGMGGSMQDVGYPPAPPRYPMQTSMGPEREAPLHRPYPSRGASSYSAYEVPQPGVPYATPPRAMTPDGDANMAGRGARQQYRS